MVGFGFFVWFVVFARGICLGFLFGLWLVCGFLQGEVCFGGGFLQGGLVLAGGSGFFARGLSARPLASPDAP